MKKQKKFRLSNVIKVFSYLLVICVLCQLFARKWWVFELTCHFQWQYTLGALLSCILFAICKEKKHTLVFACVFLWQLIVIIPGYFGPEQVDVAQTSSLSIMHFNVLRSNEDYQSLLQNIRKHKYDFISLQEVTPAWEKACQNLRDIYPNIIGISRDDSFGILFLSQKPFSYSKIEHFGQGVPSVIVRITHEQREFTILATHPLPPRTPYYSKSRNAQLVTMANYIKTISTPLVVVGDLNITPWSPYYKDFINSTNLKNTNQGFGIQTTWPSLSFLLLIPIDHCLVSKNIAVKKYQILGNYGSDHYAVYSQFSLPE